MKKKHIIIIILAVLVLAGLFTIYKLPVKDSEAIDLDSDVTIIINSTGLNYIDGKAYPKIDTKMYSVKKDSEQHKKIKEIIGNTKLYRKKESSVNRISPGGASVYIDLMFEGVTVTFRDDGFILIDDKYYGTNRFGKSDNDIYTTLSEYIQTHCTAICINNS